MPSGTLGVSLTRSVPGHASGEGTFWNICGNISAECGKVLIRIAAFGADEAEGPRSFDPGSRAPELAGGTGSRSRPRRYHRWMPAEARNPRSKAPESERQGARLLTEKRVLRQFR